MAMAIHYSWAGDVTKREKKVGRKEEGLPCSPPHRPALPSIIMVCYLGCTCIRETMVAAHAMMPSTCMQAVKSIHAFRC